MASQQIKVTIVGAQGLRDTYGASETFCVGEIYRNHKNSGCFQTKAASDSANPVWNHEHLWTEYEDGDKVVFTVFDSSLPDGILGRTELESSQFRSQPFEGELPLSHAGAGVNATLTVKVAILDEAVPFVIERVSGPMPLHDLLRPQDAPHECSQPAHTSEIKPPVTATASPKVPTMFTVAPPVSVQPPVKSYQFYKTENLYRSKPISVVSSGRTTPSAPTVVRGPVRAANAVISPPCATLPVRSGGAAAASLSGTGRLTPSFPLRTGGAMQPRGVVYQYGLCTPPVPRSTAMPGIPTSVRLVAAPTTKVA
jgi:hypothetical protein